MRFDLPLHLRFIAGMIAILLGISAAVVVINYGNGYYDKGYDLSATFDRSTPGLYPGSSVKVRGITIGEVTSINLEPDGRARVELFMHPDAKVADTAVASIEPLSIFGPKFINVQQGDHELTGGYVPENGSIPKTTPPLEFTETLAKATELFAKIDTEELITVLHALADGVSGLGPQFSATVDNLTTLTDVLAAHTDDTNRILANAAALSSTLARRGDDIVATAKDLHAVLPEIYSRPDQISALLDSVTQLSTQVGAVLGNPELEPTVAGLSNLIGSINQNRASIPDFIKALNLFFGQLADVIRVPGPNGSLLGALRGHLGTTFCEIFSSGLCPPLSAANAISPAATSTIAAFVPSLSEQAPPAALSSQGGPVADAARALLDALQLRTLASLVAK